MNWSFLKKPAFLSKPVFLTRNSFSQKKFLWILIAAAAVIVAYQFLIVPLVEAKKKADQEIALNQRLLARYTEIL